MGAGAAVLIGALVTGLLAHASDQDFLKRCPGAQHCDPALKPLQARTQRLALATDVLLIAGAGALGTGVTLFLLADREGEAASTRATGLTRSSTLGLGTLTEGSSVPRGANVHAFSDKVVQEVPKLKGHKFFTAENRVAIVDTQGDKVQLVLEEKR